MAKKDSFVLYTDQKAVIDKLSNEQAGQLIKAIYEYVETGNLHELDMTLDLVITPFITTLDRDKQKYEEISKIRANASKSKQKKQMVTNDNKCNDSDTDSVSDSDNKKKKKKKTFEDVFSENQFSKKLEIAIRDFIDMRKAIKKPMTTKALELLIRNLKKLTNLEDEQIAILNQSIEHSWQTVYPLKSNNVKASSSVKHEQRKYTETEFNQFYANR